MLSKRSNLLPKWKIINEKCISSTTKAVLKEPLPAAAYQPNVVETNKYEKWEKRGLFKAETESNKSTFSIVLPPPNVTGKLHLGHALACTIQDVIVRRKRSQACNVLWLPGTDHAGIATQGVVEKYLKIKYGINRHDISREKFNSEIWQWKSKYGETISKQLKTLGSSLDWSRQVFTMDQRHTTAVNEAFIRLFQKGLIYRKKALVNWCNKLRSTVSDIEVENLTIDKPTDIVLPSYNNAVKFGLMYDLVYKIVDSEDEIVVSTTMPETMLGDTAIAVHPNDKRYEHLKDKRAIHPFRKKTIPIIFDKFVDTDFGTGAVKITPAHSKVDYEVAQQHKLPLLQVFDEYRNIINSEIFNGLNRYECREILVQKLNNMGLLKGVKPHKMTLPICSRTGDVIEQLPKEQWFLSCKELNKTASELVENGSLKIEPYKFVKSWRDWTGSERDWCVSRQLWWGHQIPAYKCKAEDNIVWIAANDEDTAKIEASKFLRTMPEVIKAERDSDVLDTWFSSGIYPFAALGWPDLDKDDYNKFYPLSMMATGHDILGFWVHRMVMLGLELTGRLPFDNVLLHGIICDSRGSKMSKSRGNVIDPLDVINGISLKELKAKTQEMHRDGILSKEELNKALAYHKSNFSKNDGIPECGVDALRFTLLSQDIKSHFVNFDIEQCHANKLFCNKIWQSIKYMQLQFAKLKEIDEELSCNDLTYFDKWILSRLADMVKIVNQSIETYEFHLATKSLKNLIYNEFCDVYLEATKSGFDSENPKMSYAHAHTLSVVLNTSLRCLAPFMVYLTDAIIPTIPAFETNIIHNFNDESNKYFDFPTYQVFESWKDDNLEKNIENILKIVSLIRQVKSLYNMTNKLKPNVFIETTENNLSLNLDANKNIVAHLAKINQIEFSKNDKLNYICGTVDKNTKVYIELLGDDLDNVVLNARNKIQKKIKKLEDALSKLDSTLSNENCIENTSQRSKNMVDETFLAKKEELKQLKRLIVN